MRCSGHLVARGTQHPRSRPRPPPQRGRHAGGRRPRHGAALRCAGRGPRCGRARRRSAPAASHEPARKAADQARVRELAAGPGVVIVCGRFEGVDERVIEARGARGSLHRRLRALGRRNGRHGAARRLRAAVSRRHGQGSLGRPTRASRATSSNIRITPARANGRAADPRGPAQRQPRRHRTLAARRQPSGSRASGGRICWVKGEGVSSEW